MDEDHNRHTRTTIRIEGTVQGVGFRVNARRRAQDLGIDVHPVNMDDGSVRITVSGDAAQVQQFIEWCREGPRLARVSDVRVVHDST